MPGRHQTYAVKHRNSSNARARASAPPPINVSNPLDHYKSPFDLSGRLKVVPERMFESKVPFELSEGKFSYEDAANPINQLGPIIEQDVPVVTSNDFASFMAAFGKRCNFQQLGPEDDVDDASFAEALRMVRGLRDDFEPWEENPEDRERWLSKFDSGKQARMRAAWDCIHDADAKYIGTKDLSVKLEVLCGKRDDPTWAPRIIYAGNDAFNAITGPALMVVMERMVSLTQTQDVGPIRVKYAYKASDVALCAFIRDDLYPEIVEGDFSRNDREQRSRVALIFDEWLAKVGMPTWLRELLLDLEHYKVQNRRFGVSAKLKYQLPTGTTSTTARNSAYNTTMFAVACSRQKRKGKALILGDDLLAALNKRLKLDKWIADVASFKMVLKAKAPQLDGEATFLSRRIFAGVEEACMVPLLGKMLVRFNVRGTSNEACSDSAYMAGKALSYAYECRHVPLLRDLFLERYDAEDAAAVTLDDLSWFTRSSGIDLTNIVDAIKNERVIVDRDSFEVWCLELYDLDLIQIEEMFRRVVCSADMLVLDLPEIELMSRDYM